MGQPELHREAGRPESNEAVSSLSGEADKWSQIQKGFREALKLAVNKVLEPGKEVPKQRRMQRQMALHPSPPRSPAGNPAKAGSTAPARGRHRRPVQGRVFEGCGCRRLSEP